MRVALAILFVAVVGRAAGASEGSSWFSDIAACVKEASSTQAHSECATPQLEACVEADGHTIDPGCLVAATDRLSRATDAAFERFSQEWIESDVSDVAGIGLLLVQKKRAVGAVECRFQEQIVGYGRERRRPLNPDQNSTYAACLYAWEVAALRKLLEFVGEDYEHVFQD